MHPVPRPAPSPCFTFTVSSQGLTLLHPYPDRSYRVWDAVQPVFLTLVPCYNDTNLVVLPTNSLHSDRVSAPEIDPLAELQNQHVPPIEQSNKRKLIECAATQKKTRKYLSRKNPFITRLLEHNNRQHELPLLQKASHPGGSPIQNKTNCAIIQLVQDAIKSQKAFFQNKNLSLPDVFVEQALELLPSLPMLNNAAKSLANRGIRVLFSKKKIYLADNLIDTYCNIVQNDKTNKLSEVCNDLWSMIADFPFIPKVSEESGIIQARSPGFSSRRRRSVHRPTASVEEKTGENPTPTIYCHRPETWNLDRAKASGIDDRKSVHISNIDRLAIVDPRELSRGSKSKFQADGSIGKKQLKKRFSEERFLSEKKRFIGRLFHHYSRQHELDSKQQIFTNENKKLTGVRKDMNGALVQVVQAAIKSQTALFQNPILPLPQTFKQKIQALLPSSKNYHPNNSTNQRLHDLAKPLTNKGIKISFSTNQISLEDSLIETYREIVQNEKTDKLSEVCNDLWTMIADYPFIPGVLHNPDLSRTTPFQTKINDKNDGTI